MTQATALALSLLLEIPVLVGICMLLRWVPREDLGRLVLVGAAATLMTHPFAWHGFGIIRQWVPPYWARAVLVEGSVAVVEGLLIGWVMRLSIGRGQALGWSANATSYGLGLVIWYVFYA